MMRSLSSAIAALKNHQLYLDVIAANVANVNTTAYKSSKVTFQELMSQTISAATAPQDGLAGTNAVQVGLGMALGSINTNFTQGSPTSTGKMTDLYIEGDGFFVIEGTNGTMYTRDGTTDVAVDGTVVNTSTGMHLLGGRPMRKAVSTRPRPWRRSRSPLARAWPAPPGMWSSRGTCLAEDATGTEVTSQFGVYDSLGGIQTWS